MNLQGMVLMSRIATAEPEGIHTKNRTFGFAA